VGAAFDESNKTTDQPNPTSDHGIESRLSAAGRCGSTVTDATNVVEVDVVDVEEPVVVVVPGPAGTVDSTGTGAVVAGALGVEVNPATVVSVSLSPQAEKTNRLTRIRTIVRTFTPLREMKPA
jgi:hypothetical protein